MPHPNTSDADDATPVLPDPVVLTPEQEARAQKLADTSYEIDLARIVVAFGDRLALLEANFSRLGAAVDGLLAQPTVTVDSVAQVVRLEKQVKAFEQRLANAGR